MRPIDINSFRFDPDSASVRIRISRQATDDPRRGFGAGSAVVWGAADRGLRGRGSALVGHVLEASHLGESSTGARTPRRWLPRCHGVGSVQLLAGLGQVRHGPGGCRRSWWLADGDLEGRPQTHQLPVGIESSSDGAVVEYRGHEGLLPGRFCVAGKLWIRLGVDNHARFVNNKVTVRTSLRTCLYQADSN